jgi:cytochrome c peroxidase
LAACAAFAIALCAVLLPSFRPAGAIVATPDDASVAALGKHLFFDPALSASGRLSCATCHSAAHAYGPPNGRAVQLGGIHLDRQGMRAVPSLRYTLNRTPKWFHTIPNNIEEQLTEAEPPAGGFTDDGRFDRLRDQAAFPLLDSNEMANADAAAVVAKVRRAPYAADFRAAFGSGVFANVATAFERVRYAIERFELTDTSFHPFTSKYDAYLDGLAKLTPQETRGKRLFDDPQKAGCEICHPDAKGANGAHPVFTDCQFEALGVPRNAELTRNRDPHYYDLGLCGPLRHDQAKTAGFCGLFKTPTLRNVATRTVFFHNGRFHTLRDALRFYVQRDTNPEKWYPVDRNGHVAKFDDVPAIYHANVDTIDAPLTGKPGGKPIWNDRDIDDVIAYLKTLNDGYTTRPNNAGISPL